MTVEKLIVRSPWFVAFAIVAAVHLILNGADVTPWDGITKVMLAPLLAAWVLSSHGPKIIAAALVACAFGDLFLLWDGTFIIGMAAFAIGHICFIRFFISHGALQGIRTNPWVLLAYSAAALVMVVYTWSGLGELQIPVPFYAAVLVCTAATSLAYNKIAGLGGALFLFSDAIILLGQAGKWQPEPTDIAIMASYILALLLLTVGILSQEKMELGTINR